uniref:Transcription initiation factor TFIID subunit 8-like n=1 Tax=Nicotiana tabacum TaxID=4097 RepID=A0A1S3ZP86_TOBAC|nr:PREDICTED: transcription initiation factor TFIID subunit 8-like [Nicotiana tabacum]
MRSNRNRLSAAIPLPSTASTESDYAFTLTRIAVAQICDSIGFTAAEAPALRTLTDVAARYLRSIAKSAADTANSAGRTQSQLVDTVAAVDELSSVIGFAEAWRATGSLLNSGAVKNLVSFSKYSEEIPFAKPLPRKVFSIGRGKGLRNVDSNEYIGGEGKHIPKWLPIMPVIEKEEERGGKRKEIWGFCGKNEEMEREMKLEKKDMEWERKGIELPLKRGKVRFKIGNGGGVVGVYRRGGIGKRVLCESWICQEQNQKKSL